MHRQKVNKQASAKKFRGQVGRTKAANVCGPQSAAGPMRGGWRL